MVPVLLIKIDCVILQDVDAMTFYMLLDFLQVAWKLDIADLTSVDRSTVEQP